MVRDTVSGALWSSREVRAVGRRPVVLVLQQDDSLRRLIGKALDTEGYVTLEAHTAMEALAVRDRSSGDIDLVVTDLAQPGLAGPFGLRERLGPTTKFLYLLLYTTEALVPEEEFTFFLQNPFRGRAFEEKLRDIFRRR